MKLRNPNLWKLEDGDNQAMLEVMENKIRCENKRRLRVGSEFGAKVVGMLPHLWGTFSFQ